MVTINIRIINVLCIYGLKKKKKKVTKNSKVYVTSQHYANPFSEHICLQLRLLDEKASSGSLIQYFTHR